MAGTFAGKVALVTGAGQNIGRQGADIKSGQRMTFILKPGQGTQVDVNGAVKGTIKGEDFAKALLSIWLGDPPNPEIKSGLLGGACG